MQDQHLCAAEQGGVQRKAGVFGGGADQRDGAALDIGQKAVLLGTVEAVDLVNEQQRATPLQAECALCLGKDAFEVRDPGKYRADGGVAHADAVGQQPGDAGFARARRPPQNRRGQAPRRHHAPDGAFWPGQMFLPDDVGEGGRAQPFRKGACVGGLRGRRGCFWGKEFGHALL